jgi:hypothetical protein
MRIYHCCRSLSKLVLVIALSALSVSSFASFYQADTMAAYCHEYIKLIELQNPVSQLEAGVCSGYIASSIEIMDLSERLCDRSKINLDDVVRQYVARVENSVDAKKYSATYVLVELLQEKYSCNQP